MLQTTAPATFNAGPLIHGCDAASSIVQDALASPFFSPLFDADELAEAKRHIAVADRQHEMFVDRTVIAFVRVISGAEWLNHVCPPQSSELPVWVATAIENARARHDVNPVSALGRVAASYAEIAVDATAQVKQEWRRLELVLCEAAVIGPKTDALPTPKYPSRDDQLVTAVELLMGREEWDHVWSEMTYFAGNLEARFALRDQWKARREFDRVIAGARLEFRSIGAECGLHGVYAGPTPIADLTERTEPDAAPVETVSSPAPAPLANGKATQNLTHTEELVDAAIRKLGKCTARDLKRETGTTEQTLYTHVIPALIKKRGLLTRPYRYE